MAIQIVKSKLLKTRILMSSNAIKSVIPETMKLTKANVEHMLAKYPMVYIKPDLGKGGVGIMRVERLRTNQLKLQYKTITSLFNDMNTIYDKILQIKRNRPYLVQQGIHLLKHEGRPFDIRVMVQRNLKGRWEMTGIIGRVAHPSRIVTNYYSGGTPMDYNKIMKHHLNKTENKRLFDVLTKMGIDVARHLKRKYPGIKEVGLDVAIDSNFKPWLLEVNTLPNPFLFRKSADKSLYKRIAKYAAAYGRFNDRYCPELAKKRKQKKNLTSTSRSEVSI